MFDLSFFELLVIGAVALVVIGPERLPRVARTAGQWVGKIQRYVSDVKNDINREMEIDELRRLRAEMNETARSVEATARSMETSL
ncbi:MAG: Sec-independent protein translocase protein TatB, partial [Pigmentiphaga sp.]